MRLISTTVLIISIRLRLIPSFNVLKVSIPIAPPTMVIYLDCSAAIICVILSESPAIQADLSFAFKLAISEAVVIVVFIVCLLIVFLYLGGNRSGFRVAAYPHLSEVIELVIGTVEVILCRVWYPRLCADGRAGAARS